MIAKQLSASHRRLIATLAMVEGMVISIQEYYAVAKRKKTILGLASTLQERCKEAIWEWGFIDSISNDDFLHIKGWIKSYEEKALPTEAPITFLTFLHLCLLQNTLDELVSAKAKPTRVNLIQRIILTVTAIHKYYDKEFMDVGEADRALEAERVFQCMLPSL